MRDRQIDWEALRRRLEAAAASLEPGPDQTRRILDARARALARPPGKPDSTQHLEVLTFALAAETYGVETCHVREVCQLKDLTTVPCTPPFVAGITNLRGRILTVIDLRKFFELPSRGLTELNRVIVLRGGGNELGLLADSIDGVRAVAAAALQAALPTLTGVRARILKGVTNQMLVVLDGHRLLGDTDLKVNAQVTR